MNLQTGDEETEILNMIMDTRFRSLREHLFPQVASTTTFNTIEVQVNSDDGQAGKHSE
jgi:hypothetical protein